MKNIHILPTDKPSRLFIAEKDIDMFILSDKFELGNKLCENQNIYITSDEEIKEGDWCLLNNRLVVRYFKPPVESKSFKKIILTTDQDLIKDGVQAIDDDFLEWYVKNPSCEEVKVGEIYPSNCCINKEGKTKMNNDCMERNRCLHYKIIIPSKDDLKIGDNTNFGIITDINEKSVCFGKNKVGVDVWYKKSYVVKFPNLVLEEPKQETLEEAAETKLYQTINKIIDGGKDLQKGYNVTRGQAVDYAFEIALKVAKWQQERMYSEEETIQLLIKFNQEIQEVEDVRIWFEQFKNK